MAQRNMARGCLRNRRKPSRTHCQPEDAGGMLLAWCGLLDDLSKVNALCPHYGARLLRQLRQAREVARLQHSFEMAGSCGFSVWAGLGRK